MQQSRVGARPGKAPPRPKRGIRIRSPDDRPTDERTHHVQRHRAICRTEQGQCRASDQARSARHRERREACPPEPDAAKVVLAQGVEGATAVDVGQGRAGPDGAPRQVRRDRRADRDRSTRRASTRWRRKRKRSTRRSPKKRGRRTRRMSRRGSRRPARPRRPVRTSGFNAFKSTVAATTAAFDQFQKATKQVVNLADASVRAAAANASKVAPKGRRAA